MRSIFKQADAQVPSVVCQKQTFLKQLCVNKVGAGHGLISSQGCYGKLLVSLNAA
ncbi:MAG: hypothetical protein ACFWUK_01080 [Serratia liquefaciens]